MQLNAGLKVRQDDKRDSSLDQALTAAAAALLKEIHTEPVPQSIIDLANRLQAVLDKTAGRTSGTCANL